LFACNPKTAQSIFTKISGKVWHEPRKNPLDFGGNPDHIMSYYATCFTKCLFNSN